MHFHHGTGCCPRLELETGPPPPCVLPPRCCIDMERRAPRHHCVITPSHGALSTAHVRLLPTAACSDCPNSVSGPAQPAVAGATEPATLCRNPAEAARKEACGSGVVAASNSAGRFVGRALIAGRAESGRATVEAMVTAGGAAAMDLGAAPLSEAAAVPGLAAREEGPLPDCVAECFDGAENGNAGSGGGGGSGGSGWWG
jgi:hypothetical protein